MTFILNRHIVFYVMGIISLLVIGIVAGDVAAKVGRDILNLSAQASQTLYTLLVPLFTSILEIVGIHLWFTKALS